MTEAEELELLELERERALAGMEPPKSEGAPFSGMGDVKLAESQPPPPPRSNFFPNAAQMPWDGVMGSAAKVGVGALDLLGAPQRALGDDMADPSSHYLKPSTDAAVARAKADLEAHPEAQNLPLPMGGATMGAVMMPTPAMAPGLTEMGGRLPDDPMLLLGPLVKAIQQSPKLFTWLGKATGLANKGAGRLAEEMSGVSEDALRMAGTKAGREALQNSAGKGREIGDELLRNIENADDFLPERQVVDEALDKMGPIDLGSAVRSLEGSKGSAVAGRLSPEKGAANSSIQKYVDFLRGGELPEDLAQGAQAARRAAGEASVDAVATGAQASLDARAAAQATRAQASAQSKAGKAAAQAQKAKKAPEEAFYSWDRKEAQAAIPKAMEDARQAATKAREAATEARAKVAVGEISQAEANAAQKAAEAAERSADVMEVAARIKGGEKLPAIAKEYAAKGLAKDDLRDLLQQAKKKAESVKELPDQVVSAREYRDLRRDLDVPVNWEQEGAGIKNNALKAGRTTMKNELLRKAEESGDPKYAEAMRSWSDKLDKLEKIKEQLGSTASTRDRRVEQFINNLFGKNSEHKQRLMRDLDEIFQSDLTGRAKTAQLASQLGPDGTAGWLPRQFTGRSALGYVTGAGAATATGNPLAAAAPVLFASPKVASRLTLPALTKMEEGLKAAGVKLTPKAERAMEALKKPASEAQKARLASIVAAELELQMPPNAIPFRMKDAAEGEEPERVKKIRAALDRAKDEKTRQRLQAELDRELGITVSMKGN